MRDEGKKSAVALLQLTTNGPKSITSCESRKIVISGKGVKKAKVELKRNTKECKPKPIDLSRADDCDFIGVQEGSLCLLPFPDDYYTVKDSSSSTGRRIAFTDGGDAAERGRQADRGGALQPQRRLQPGPGDHAQGPGPRQRPRRSTKTNPIPLSDLSRNESQDSKEPIVVIDAETGKRGADLGRDRLEREHAGEHRAADPRRDASSRPGTATSSPCASSRTRAATKLTAPEGFRYYRDDLPSNEAAINDQRKRFDKIFRALRKVKVKRANLYLAWDFTVSSDENIAQRLLHIRNDAFAQLGDTNLGDGVVQGTAPAFTIDTVDDQPEPGDRPPRHAARSRSRAT